MSSGPRGSNVVFVGNIPYELTEDQLTEVFKEVGPVVSFRLVFDRDSGRPRGYGFCEYHDSETAASAVRNLNNVEVGGRQLRVDYADGDPAASSTSAPQGERPSGEQQQQQRQPQPQQPPQQTPPQQPPQIVSPPSTTAQQQQQTVIENISQTEQNSMNQTQLLEILSTMKLYIQTHYEQARILLTQNPQLSYSLFQTMVQLNLIDPSILPNLLVQNVPQQQNQPAPVQNTSQVVGGVNFGPQNVPPAPAVPQHQPQHQQQHQQQQQQQQQQQPPMYGGMPQQPQPMMQQPMQQQPIQPLPMQPPPIQQQPPQPIQQAIQQSMGMPAINSGMLSVMSNTGTHVGNVNINDLQMQEASQKSLLLQVLNLPQQQIDSLSPDQRSSLIALKQQLLLQTRQT